MAEQAASSEAAGATPRLVIELVPRTSWYINVRALVGRATWDRIRRLVYQQCANRCEVCGGHGPAHPVECHEVWAYDEATGIQRLVRMIGLCPACHEVKHFGRAGQLGRTEPARTHLQQVNGWTPRQTTVHIAEAFATWRRRSRRPWTLDLAGLAPYVTPEELAAIQAQASVPPAGQEARMTHD